MAERDDNFLRTGDLVTFKYVRFQAFLTGEGILSEDVSVSPKISSFEDHLFQVCAQRQYSAKLEYEDFLAKTDGGNNLDEAAKKHYSALVRGKGNEIRMNEVYMKHKIGNNVLFGDTVQLLHIKSRKYLTVKPGAVARDERENMTVYLSSEGDQYSWIQLLPRYKIDREGDRVSNNTEVVMHVSERPSEHIHCADRAPNGMRNREVNATMETGSPWRVNIYQSSQNGIDPKLLMFGQLVYIKDPEFNTTLQVFQMPINSKQQLKELKNVVHDGVDGDDDDLSLEGNSIEGSSVEQLSVSVKHDNDDDDSDAESMTSADEFVEDYGHIILKPSVDDTIDTNSIWVLESRSIIKGGALMWRNSQILLRHLNTGTYFSSVDNGEDEYVSESCIFSTADRPGDKNTLLQINELHSESEMLQNGKAVQLRQGHMYLERSDYNDRFKIFTCSGTRNRMKATNLIMVRYTESSSSSSALGFEISMDIHVGKSISNLIYKFLDLTKVPSLRDTKQTHVWPDIDQSERNTFFESVNSIMLFVAGFPIECDENTKATFKSQASVVKRRQTLVREQGTLEGILHILHKLIPISERLSTGDAAAHQFNEGGLLSSARTIVSTCLKLLGELTCGNSVNQMLVAEYMNVVLSHCSTEKLAATITEEMLSSNRMLQETKMGNDEIRTFAEKLRDSQMNSMFLGLIKASCSCQGVGVSSNQLNVTNILLGEYEDEFIKVNSNFDSPRPMDWLQMNNANLYLPPAGSPQGETLFGSILFTAGAPMVTLTWTNKDKRLLPSSLFNKKEVKIWELYRVVNVAKAAASELQGSSLFATQSNNKDKTVVSKEDTYKISIGEFFGAQLSLAADMCLDRNYTVINQLIKRYPFETLVSIIRKRSTPSFAKSACLSLLTNMYVDCDPQVHIMLPRLTRTWTELSDESAATIRCVDDDDKFKFGLLQVTISEHVRSLSGNPYMPETRHMMQLLHKLLAFSFYGTTERLIDVIDPLVAALDRTNLNYEDNFDTSMTVANSSGPKTKGRRSSVAESSSRRGAKADVTSEKAAKSLSVDTLESNAMEDEEILNADDFEIKMRWQARVLDIFESLEVTFFMLFLVLASVAIAVYQYITNADDFIFTIAEYVIFALFALDVLVRGYCYKVIRGPLRDFACDPFNLLDIAVVLIDVLTFIVTAVLTQLATGNTNDITMFNKVIKVMRLLRLLRVMRIVRILNAIASNLAGVEIFAVKWVDPPRYHKSSTETVLTMVEMANILGTVQLTVEDRNISLLMHGFYHWYSEFKDEPADNEDAISAAVKTFEEVADGMAELRVSNDAYDDIFLDLLMYNNTELVQSSMSILMTHHSSKNVLLTNIQRMQVLVNHRREQQYDKLDKLVLLLKRECDTHDIWGRLQTDEHKHTSGETHRALKEIKLICHRRREVLKFDEDFEPDRIIQDILRNLGCFDVCIKVIQLLETIDPHTPNSDQSKNTRTLALEASELLYWFVLGNEQNQALAYKHISFFMRHIDAKVMLHKVLSAIFYNNEFLMKSVPRQYITDCIDLIINEGKFMQYLSLLEAIVACGEKNMIDNQYEIIRVMSSPAYIKKVLQYFCATGHPEYAKKIKAMTAVAHKQDVSVDEVTSDLAYHLNLMSLLSGCTVGRESMTTIEAKVQSMYNFVDVVDALLDPNTILLAKIRTGLFFYNAMLDVEMRLPSLKDAKCMWDLLEAFPEIFSFGKDDLRQIEKNGWGHSSSCRQKVEWMIVCAMMVQGYYGLYFDTSLFRPEVGQTGNVERVQIREKKAYELINNTFFKLRSVYEMQSPLLALEHQAVLYGALVALNDANPNKIVLTVENLHETVDGGMEGYESVTAAKEETKLREFIAAIQDNEDISDLLSEETQEFITKIENLPREADSTSESDVRYEALLRRIIAHIGGSIQTHTLGDETVKYIDEKSTLTNIWFIKIFRTMIENRWGMTINERDDDGGEEQDEAAAEVMDTLNECGVTTVCLDLLGKGVNEQLQAEAIKLIVALLFKEGGALSVQTTIYETLSRPGTDLFFLHMRSMLQNLMSWHKWQGVITLEGDEEPELPEEIILVRMLQLTCEGHYLPNQDIMRDQPNNRITVNLLDDFVQYLQILDEYKCRTSSAAANAVSDTILEVIQGPCEKNQDHFALSTELLETLNRRMRHRTQGDCVEEEENGVKKTAVDIFQGLLEGQGRRPAIYDRVLSVIHLDVIKMICTNVPDEGEEEEDESWGELKTECLVFLMMLFDFKPSLRDELEMEDLGDLQSEVVCVEVVWRGELQRRFFPVPEICNDIAKSSKDAFVVRADRESPESKLFDLIDAAQGLYREILHQQLLKEWNVANVFSLTNQGRVTKFNFFLVCVLNGLFIAYYENVPCDGEDTEAKDDDGELPACLRMELPVDVTGVDINVLTRIVSIVLTVFAAYTVILCFVVRLPVLYEGEIEKGNSPFISSINASMDFKTVYHTGYLALAVLSIQKQFHHLASFLLLDMISLSPVTQDTMNAIWKPRRLLFMTTVLLFICCYIYAIYGWFLYNDEDNFGEEIEVITLADAFKGYVRYGSPSGSLTENDILNKDIYHNRWFSEVSFYMVTFTLWNIIKGITIDTFVELRKDLVSRMEDTEEKCYICGIEKLVFNRALDRSAFDLHIKMDQNLWNYVYFCIFIWEQDKDDDDGLEYYIRHCVDDGDLTWFPMNKAIRLTEHLEAGAVDSLPNMFKRDLTVLETAVNDRMGVLKDKLLRSITRVEQALIYQPEAANVKPKKKTVVAEGDANATKATDPSAPPQSPERAQSAFRPMTGSVSAEFANMMSSDDFFKPANDEEELAYALVNRDKSTEHWQTQAYMDAKQLHISINDIRGVYVTDQMIGHISVRILSDTGKFDCVSDFDDESSLASSVHERKDSGESAKSSLPIAFNKQQWFVIFGGDLPKKNRKSITIQVLHTTKLFVPREIADAYPSEMQRVVAYGSVSVGDLVRSSVNEGSIVQMLKQIGPLGEELPEVELRINTAASEELITEFQGNQ
jgi:hypothetical protein